MRTVLKKEDKNKYKRQCQVEKHIHRESQGGEGIRRNCYYGAILVGWLYLL